MSQFTSEQEEGSTIDEENLDIHENEIENDE